MEAQGKKVSMTTKKLDGFTKMLTDILWTPIADRKWDVEKYLSFLLLILDELCYFCDNILCSRWKKLKIPIKSFGFLFFVIGYCSHTIMTEDILAIYSVSQYIAYSIIVNQFFSL